MLCGPGMLEGGLKAALFYSSRLPALTLLVRPYGLTWRSLAGAPSWVVAETLGNKLPQDALNPAHGSLLMVNSHSQETFFSSIG